MIPNEEYKKLFPNLTKAPQDLMAKWMEAVFLHLQKEPDPDQSNPTKKVRTLIRLSLSHTVQQHERCAHVFPLDFFIPPFLRGLPSGMSRA